MKQNMGKPLRLVILGMMGRTPFAGVAWQALHYLEGFRRLGHDVYYIEDTNDWPLILRRTLLQTTVATRLIISPG